MNRHIRKKTADLATREVCVWWAGLLLVAFLLALPVTVQAELLSFSMNAKGELREADVQLIEKDGVQYVALSSLVSQIGGGFSKTDEGLQVDLSEKTAILRSNNAQVSAVGGSFNLSRPVMLQDGEALIAVSDVTPFFDRAFNVSLKQDLPMSAQPAVSPPASSETPAVPPSTTPPATPPASGESAASTPPAVVSPAAEPPSSAGGRAVTRPIQLVVIDPGHGGGDSGVEGASKVKESVVAFAIAQKLQRVLEQKNGVRVLLTRNQDRQVSLDERTNAAVAAKGDLLISLHVGASTARAARGVEVFCCPQEATSPHPGQPYSERSRALGEAVAAAVAEGGGLANRGVSSAPCTVLRDVDMLGLLLEIGFMTTAPDETLLATDAFQEKVAEGIASGIQKYMAAQHGGEASR